MQEILPGVFLIPQNGRKGFGYSHFVKRPAGNLLLDASRIGSISDAYDWFEAQGGIAAVVISDRHLGGAMTDDLHRRFGATRYASVLEAEAIAKRGAVDHALSMARTTVEGDVMLIPTPGHTPGQLSTLLEVEGRRCLFTADFVWREAGGWRPGNLSRKVMRASFEGLRDLNFDYVVPWTGYDHTDFAVPIDDVDRAGNEMIDASTKP